MGQFHDHSMKMRIVYDEKSENGLILGDKYLPQELLAEIFCYVDYKSLLNCHLVCKRWKILIQDYVWRKKAEISLGQLLLPHKDITWHIYYCVCVRRNLLKNNSGQDGVHKYWKIVSEGGNHWKVENPPVGVPLLPSNEPVFEGRQCCFVTSYHRCAKIQIIDLQDQGLTLNVLDNLQPPIVVSEWYSCRWDCPAIYECFVQLLNADNDVLDSFQFRDSIEGERQNQWHHVSHEFTNYGQGLRKISFYHGGSDQLFWLGHYGSKMAGACVYVKLPTVKDSNNEGMTDYCTDDEGDSQTNQNSL
ncbi:F-box only protein 6 isoform X2 [Ptiloglossa arizonensis]